jgi:hypothetical protein
MLLHPHINIASSLIARWRTLVTLNSVELSFFFNRKFRRRFRVPYPLYQYIVSECNRVNLFNIKSESRVRVPTEFKVLIALRILGRGNCYDEISELSGSHESTCHAIFHEFVNAFVDHFYDVYVKTPTGERMTKVKRMYEQLGLPGCRGSMDCTHLPWDKCCASLKVQCTGKEKEPTLSFNCIVDHTRLVHHCSTVLFYQSISRSR